MTFTKDNMHYLRNEVQLIMDEKQVLMMHATREMMVEFMRNNGCLLYTSPSPRD